MPLDSSSNDLEYLLSIIGRPKQTNPEHDDLFDRYLVDIRAWRARSLEIPGLRYTD